MAITVERKKKSANRGPNLAPLRELLEAQSIHSQYHDESAKDEVLKKVSKAMGSENPLPLLREKLDTIFTPETPLSDIALHLALIETRKK